MRRLEWSELAEGSCAGTAPDPGLHLHVDMGRNEEGMLFI